MSMYEFEPEAFSEEIAEFEQAVKDMSVDPAQMLRDWYIAKGEQLEGAMVFFPEDTTYEEIMTAWGIG